MNAASALVLTFLATAAHADTRAAVTTAMDRFTAVCPAALTDPETYIASLTLPGPAGEDAVYRSDDGRYTLIHTSQAEGLTDYVELSDLTGHARRACTVRASIPDFPEAEEIADALYPLLKTRAREVIGGRIPNITPMWEPGETPEAFNSGDWYIFHMTGLWPDTADIATAQVELGAVSFFVSRTEAAE